MNKLKLSSLSLLCVVSVPAFAGMAVTDPISYTYFAQQLTDSAENTTTNIKSLTEQTKQTITQNEIFLTSKEIWTTARETQKITEDTHNAVTGTYYSPMQLLEDLEREQARFERNPPRYIDQVFAKYGNEKAEQLSPVELEEQVRQQSFDRFSAGNGLYKADAKVREREEANLNLLTASEISEYQLGESENGYLAKLKEHTSKHKDATTLASKMDVLISIASLQAEMQAKQLELQAKMAKAYASMNYEGHTDLASDAEIRASESAERTNYDDAMNRQWSN